MSLYPPPEDIPTTVWSSLPEEFRRTGQRSDWGDANKPGRPADSFLEGPAFDTNGNLYVVDIPWGRIFKVTPAGNWSLVTEYDGWPNGLKIHRDGRLFVADYRRGIVCIDPESGKVEPWLSHRYSESFRGCNDLIFARDGSLYFTDQGQSGLHQPDGRVFRYNSASQLDLLLGNAPSPNGLVLNVEESALYVAMTRDNSVWRLPFMVDGGTSKVGRFVQLSGGSSGPDGMAVDSQDRLFVCHAGNGCVWVFSKLGEPVYRIRSATGLTTTNLAFGGEDGRTIFITESETGTILKADLAVPGNTLFSHL
jgi:gluconolactonase